ncbi:MAG: holin [Clostridia bacterium]|nr:holin [Clostridia bacterium]
MKISKSTILRTALLLLVIINLILKKLGLNPLNISENEIAQFIELALEIAVIIAGWWYNNSFSKNALKAQNFLQELRKEKNDV